MSKRSNGLRQEDHDPEHLRKVLDAAKRNELPSFIQAAFGIVNPGVAYQHNYHIEAIAYHLEQCRRGQITRLIITVPPRHLKSLCVSVAYPAFLLGHDPTRRIIAASYSSELSENLNQLFRVVMQSREYRQSEEDSLYGRTLSLRELRPWHKPLQEHSLPALRELHGEVPRHDRSERL